MREGIGVRADVPTVADTKSAFIKAYRKPIPSIYSNVIQEILVQQHLMRYNTTYTYDPIFALGFVTVFDQLMDGYPSETDRDAIFKAYITALNEDPELYRSHILIFSFHFFFFFYLYVMVKNICERCSRVCVWDLVAHGFLIAKSSEL